MLFIGFTAARVAEACRLQWADVDFARKKALLGMTKNGKPREVALAPTVINALLKLKRGDDPVFGYAARWRFNQAIERTCRRGVATTASLRGCYGLATRHGWFRCPALVEHSAL